MIGEEGEDLYYGDMYDFGSEEEDSDGTRFWAPFAAFTANSIDDAKIFVKHVLTNEIYDYLENNRALPEPTALEELTIEHPCPRDSEYVEKYNLTVTPRKLPYPADLDAIIDEG